MVFQNTASIEYLVKRKFGGSIAPPIRSTSQLRTNAMLRPNPDRQQKIDQYRTELASLTALELDKLFNEEKAREQHAFQMKCQAEEAARPFNHPWATLDVDYWSKISFWTLEEAVAVSLNKDPRKVKWDGLKPLTNVSDFAAKFEAKLILVERAKEMGQLWVKTTPSVFLAWAERTRFEMPEELIESAKSLGIQVADWKAHYDGQVKLAEAARAEVTALNEKSIATSQEFIAFMDRMRATQKEIDKTQSDQMNLLKRQLAEAIQKINALETEQKPKADLPPNLNPRVKDTLLKMIIGMAIDSYGFVPTQARSPFPGELSGILIGQGLDVTDETIRNYLKQAAALLPPPIGD